MDETSVVAQPLWKRILAGTGTEIVRTSTATWSQTVRLAQFSTGLFRRRSLRRQASAAELALGQRLVDAKMGDPQLRQQIAVLDTKIRETEAVKGKTKPFKTERELLLHKMGAFALAQRAVPPILAPDRDRARDMQLACKNYEQQLKDARVSLPPSSRGDWLRVGAGYGVIGCLFVLTFFLVSGGSARQRGDNSSGPAQVADLNKLDSALKLIPSDAAFFTTTLRNREQAQIVLSSRAWATLTSLPAVKEGWKKETGPGGALAPVMQFFAQPENQPLADLLLDMVGQEFFVYGGPNSVEFAELTMATGMSRAPGLSGPNPMAVLGALLEPAARKPELVKVPDLIVGFKITDAKRAGDQLNRLEKLANDWAARMPQLQGRLKREKVAGGDFLTLSLDGKMVPWETLPLKMLEPKPGAFDVLLKKLPELKVTVSLGVRDDLVLLAVGETNQHLAKLGQGPRLMDQPEFQRLKPYADRRITAITYVSKALATRTSLLSADSDSLTRVVKQALPEELMNKAQKEKLDEDLKRIGKELRSFLPTPGASLSVSFLNGRGQESLEFDWSQYPFRDGSRPLSLLSHVGGSPLVVMLGRSKFGADQYRMVSNWVQTLHGYLDIILLPLNPSIKTTYDTLSAILFPMLKRMDKSTAEMLFPAISGGQRAFVLDAQLMSKQWHPLLPPSDKALPMLEPALVVEVNDPELLKKAMEEYRQAIDEMLSKFDEKVGGLLPRNFQSLPPPQTQQLESGMAYFYSLPEMLGLDKQLVPTAGLAQNVATLAISHAHTNRLLKPTPFAPTSGPLANLDRPMASVTYVNWAGIIDSVIPWVNLAAKVADPKKAEDVKQTQTVLDLLKVLQSYASCTYLESEVWVTHSELVFQDR